MSKHTQLIDMNWNCCWRSELGEIIALLELAKLAAWRAAERDLIIAGQLDHVIQLLFCGSIKAKLVDSAAWTEW